MFTFPINRAGASEDIKIPMTPNKDMHEKLDVSSSFAANHPCFHRLV